MSRTYAEIEHQVGRLRRLLDGLDPHSTEPEDIIELRRLLYGLYAVLRLHNAKKRKARSTSSPTEPRTTRRDPPDPSGVCATRPCRRGGALAAASGPLRSHPKCPRPMRMPSTLGGS